MADMTNSGEPMAKTQISGDATRQFALKRLKRLEEIEMGKKAQAGGPNGP